MARAGQALASLRIRLLLLVFLALAPALGLILYSSLDRRRADADQVRANAGQLANLVAAQLQQAIEGAHQTLIPLARIWGSPSGDLAEIDAESCSSFLADLLAQNALYLNFGLIARNGDLLCSGIPPGGPVNLEDRRYFQEAVRTRAFAIGDYQIGRVTGQGSLNAGYPITGADGQVRGVVFAAIDLTAISQLPARAQLPEGSFMNFTDRNGAILARYPDSERWTGTPAERNPPWQSIQQQPAGGTDEVRNVEGVRSLIAFVPLIGPSGAADAYVTVGIPASTAYADANADLTRNLVGLGVVAVLALGLAGLSAQALIVRPTRALTGATGRMAAGDLHARVGPPYGGGELGHLARAFDVMAASLEAQVEEIRQTASAVRASEARFSNIVSAAPVAVITTDDRQRIQLFNAAAEQMFGYAAAEVLGQQLDLLIPERFRGAHRERHLPGFAAGPETGRQGWNEPSGDTSIRPAETARTAPAYCRWAGLMSRSTGAGRCGTPSRSSARPTAAARSPRRTIAAGWKVWFG